MAFISPFGQLYTTGIIMPAEPIPVQQITSDNVNSRAKKISPFDPEATVPMPFQLDDHFGPFSTSIWKRNERERYRVRCVNEGYDKLRNHLPVADGEKRISKVDTLRLAIRYIKHLDAVLKNDQHVYRCRCFHGFKEESEGNVQIDMDYNSDYERRMFGTARNTGGQSPIKTFKSTLSPHTTPTKGHSDRFIPLRQPSEEWNSRYMSIAGNGENSPFKKPAPRSNNQMNVSPPSNPAPNEEIRQDQVVMRALLRNEVLNDNIDDIKFQGIQANMREAENDKTVEIFPSSPGGGLFTYGNKTPTKYGGASTSTINSCVSPFSGPLSEDSQRLLKSPRKPQRKVPKNPYKVLDAPDLQDDFYLNLVDWSSQNMLSVGLNTCVYLWSACNSQVTKLCDLQTEQDSVTSVQWAEKGDLLAIGTTKGTTQIWDIATSKKISELNSHTARIGCLAWNGDVICSGSRDRHIVQRDIRAPDTTERRLSHHRQEVCGLKWSPDKQFLASGGNDNNLLVWCHRRDQPIQIYSEHNAAVKALAWSPHHHGLLVSGGGTADRCLRFWNTLTGQPMQCIDTGSQVCNVAWSKHSSELVSTHGYSYNQVIIWKYPSLQPVTKLTGHQFRVLYLAMSPDGEAIVTGAGDETLRFWHVFSKSSQLRAPRSKLNLFNSIR